MVSIEIADALAAAGRALDAATGRHEPLQLIEQLKNSNRSLVLRAAGDHVGRVIVRAYEVGERPPEAWAREVVALRLLAPVADVPVPRLLASGTQPPVTVLEDLGDGQSLADVLLGTDPFRAEHHLCQWVDAIADLHSATSGLGAELGLQVARLTGQQPRTSIDALRHVPKGVQDVVEIPAGLDAEVDTLVAMLTADGPAALTPTDACPDNNIVTPEGLRLIDFEFAEYRHIAWDAAYLRVPFPSCWCSWAIPAEVLDEALARYRRRLAATVPYVATAAFDRALDAATLAWALVTAQWFLPAAFADDPPISDDRVVAPTRRTLLYHRMSYAATQSTGQFPAINRLARSVLNQLRSRWPASKLTLEVAPAFRNRN